MRANHAACAAILACVPLAALGAASPPQGALAGCPARSPTPDSITLVLNLAARALLPTNPATRGYTTAVAGAIALRLSAVPLRMPAYVGHRLAGDGASRVSGAHPDLEGVYALTLRANGRVARAAVLTTSLDVAMDRAVLAAVAVADRAGALPRAPGGAGDSVTLRLVLSTTDSGRTLAPGTAVIRRLRAPMRRYEQPLAMLPDQPAPPYPPALRARGVEGRVDVSFVVDDSGAVMPATISVRGATDPAFVQSVLRVLPESRFDAAQVDGCPVPFRAAMPFVFSLGH